MISNTFVPYQERRPATDPSVPPSPPASPPSHPSRNVTGSLPIDHGMQKAKYPLNHCQPRQVFAAAARAQQQTEMSKNRHSSPSWRLENPNAGQAVQQQLQRDVHKAFSIEQQREALKWVTAAKRLGNILDLANSPMSVLPRLRPRDATAPRIHVPPLGSRRIICPSGHQYLQSTGYIRSVPVFRPTLDIRRIVPDRANDRDEGYLHAYRVSRSDERTRQAAIERAAWDVNMLEWREGIRSLPAEDHKGEGKLPRIMANLQALN